MKSCRLFILLNLFIFSAAAQSELIVRDLQFTEGPAIDDKGNLFFSDVRAQKIYKYSEKGELSLFLDNTGGANGLYFDKKGNLFACAGYDRKVISISPGREVRTIVSHYNGKKLNSPNDLWIDPKGGVYFTDPRYGNTDNIEQDGMHVYYWFSGLEEPIRVTTDLVRPNGIVGTPDGRTLYIVDQGVEKTWRYTIKPDGTLEGKTLFAEYGGDGMTLDNKKRVYITHQNSVICFTEAGKKLNSFNFKNSTTNVLYYKNQLFVTTQGGEVFRVRLKSE